MSPRTGSFLQYFSELCLSSQRLRPLRCHFSSSTSLLKHSLKTRRGGDLGAHLPKYIIPADADVPQYPYGPRLIYKQANKGLYGRATIRTGNNVSHRTKTKTRRTWAPNVLSKSLYSVVFKKRVKLRVTSRVLKTIDREGGLDEYLLKQSKARIKDLGPLGWALRHTLIKRPEVIARLRAEALALGIPQEAIDAQWPNPTQTPIQELTDVVEDSLQQHDIRESQLNQTANSEDASEDPDDWVKLARPAEEHVR